MTCPLCDASLDRSTLLAADGDGRDLRGFRCPNGHGVFLPSDLYAAWHNENSPTDTLDFAAMTGDVGDVKKAKLCPQDGRILGRYRTHADGFWIDRCATCGGVWFDGAEWDATVASGLHEMLYRVFTDAWQRESEEAAASAKHDERLAESVGASDLERADAFRDWIWSHPERHRLLARVTSRPDATGDGT